jgi:predicted secreted hydrolase
MRVWIALGVILAFLLVLMGKWNSGPSGTDPSIPLPFEGLAEIASGFSDPPREWVYRFPEDHGSHPEQFGEYWLFAGRLAGADEDPLGFRLAVYRLALTPERHTTESPWSTREVFWAQLVLDSADPGQRLAEERFSRAAFGLSGSEDGRIWLDDWSVTHDPACDCFSLSARTGERSLNLILSPSISAPVPIKGVPGLDTAEPGSHGYWWPGLQVQGQIGDGERTREVSGQAVIEHAWGRRLPAAQGQMTLNRFWVVLADGTSVRCLQLRRRGTGGVPLGDCLFLRPDGETLQVSGRDLDASARSREGYPLQWDLKSPGTATSLAVRARQESAPLEFRLPVWSGLMHAEGTRDGRPLAGWGWLELSGY